MTRSDLPRLLKDILYKRGGNGSIVDVCKDFWEQYEVELKDSGDLFFTWQYDIRWAATRLRETNRMKEASKSPKGIWELS